MAIYSQDWRIGLEVKPKYQSHLRFGERGTVIAVLPTSIPKCDELTIRMNNKDVIRDHADNWITA